MTTPTPLHAKSAKPAKAAKPEKAETTGRDPAAVREAAGLSIKQMADLMGMGLDGYQAWENGLRRPGGPALRLLRLIDNDPKKVIDVLQG